MDAGPIASGIAFDGYDENGVAKHFRIVHPTLPRYGINY